MVRSLPQTGSRHWPAVFATDHGSTYAVRASQTWRHIARGGCMLLARDQAATIDVYCGKPKGRYQSRARYF